MDKVKRNFMGFEYKKCGMVSTFTFAGMNIYSRVGSARELLGFGWRTNGNN